MRVRPNVGINYGQIDFAEWSFISLSCLPLNVESLSSLEHQQFVASECQSHSSVVTL